MVVGLHLLCFVGDTHGVCSASFPIVQSVIPGLRNLLVALIAKQTLIYLLVSRNWWNHGSSFRLVDSWWSAKCGCLMSWFAAFVILTANFSHFTCRRGQFKVSIYGSGKIYASHPARWESIRWSLIEHFGLFYADCVAQPHNDPRKFQTLSKGHFELDWGSPPWDIVTG